MTDVELETRNFLRELDTFGQPPPPQRLVSDVDSKAMSKEFELKLHHINLEKQKHVQNGKWNPKLGKSYNSKSFAQLNSNGNNTYISAEKNAMSTEEISKLKEQVVSASRPINPWYEQQRYSPTLSAKFIRDTVRKDLNVNEKHSKPIVTKTSVPYNYTNVATVSGENTISGIMNAIKSNSSQNITSISPASASSNTETSRSSISTAGSSTTTWSDQNEDTYRATPCAANSSFRALISPAKTYYHSGPPIRRPSRNLVNGSDIDRNETLLMNGNAEKKSINDAYSNAGQLPSTTISNKYDDKHQRNNATVIPPWRKKSMDSVTSNDSGVSIQRKKYDEITDNLEKQLNLNRKPIGICNLCGKAIMEEACATFALGQIYHQNCFTCDMCGRTLRGKKFYKVREKKYCEEDYLYSGMHETSERCAVCSHLIVDVVLEALGKFYHPRCFRCEKCKCCLDGVPFAADSKGHAYCTEDYHRLFAPKCAACLQAIMPNKETGETVHVVAINRDYHIECYVCKGCGMQLTDEPEKRCYPLNNHLLCKNCHIHWVRTGGDSKPITDL